jgi:hydrogenase nickel incorporation protein HypA/HybF
MHEVSLMAQMLEIARSEAAHAGARRISLIHLRAGALSGVVPEALRFAFEVLRGADAVTAGARIEIEPVAIRCRCRTCGREFEPSDAIFVCPDCEGLDAEILSGRELELTRMEVL